LVRRADEAGHLVTAPDEQRLQPQRNLTVSSRDDNAHVLTVRPADPSSDRS
jgi:hypothetical protein